LFVDERDLAPGEPAHLRAMVLDRALVVLDTYESLTLYRRSPGR
jgi:hypothetical protein